MQSRREFMKMMAAGAIGLSSFAFSRHTVPNSKKRRLNILLLMTDQHRADCLGWDGNSVIKTPNLDRLSREGVHFPHAYSSTPTCTPARAGLLTGMAPWHHGMLGFGRLAERYPLELQRSIREAGYYTFAIGKLHYYPQRNLHGFHGALLDESGRVEAPGFVSDYRRWFKERAPDLDPDATGIGWNDYRSGVYALPEELHPTHWTGQMAVDFITKYERSEPFFLKVSFARPHSPYDPPARFMDMYNEGDIPAPYIGKWAERFAVRQGPASREPWHGDFGLQQVRRSRRGYYGSVSFIDEEIGRILDALDRRGMLDETFIMFIADHGDMTGDHHLWRKSYAYESSARIPFIVRWPRSMGMVARRGTKLLQPVELRDVFPTLLEVAGEQIPGTLDGRSLLPLIRQPTIRWRSFIDLEHDICYAAENHWNALTDGVWKYIFHAYDGSEQLFHLENDPGELSDLAEDPKYAGTLETWRQRLVEHLSERGEEFVSNGKLKTRPHSLLYSPNFPKPRE